MIQEVQLWQILTSITIIIEKCNQMLFELLYRSSQLSLAHRICHANNPVSCFGINQKVNSMQRRHWCLSNMVHDR